MVALGVSGLQGEGQINITLDAVKQSLRDAQTIPFPVAMPMVRSYHGPARLFGFLLIAPKYPFCFRVDLAMYGRTHRQGCCSW